jgi:hypothetical protein
MKGEYNGLQAKIKEVSPTATYIHCWAHQLNLVIVDCVSCLQGVDQFFNKLAAIYTYFTQSIVRHEKFKQVQQEMLKAFNEKQNQSSAKCCHLSKPHKVNS